MKTPPRERLAWRQLPVLLITVMAILGIFIEGAWYERYDLWPTKVPLVLLVGWLIARCTSSSS